MFQSLTDIQRRMSSGHCTEKPEGSKTSSRKRKRSSSGSSDFEGSIEGLISSSHRDKRKRHYQNHSRDEFRKERPPTLNGEIKNGQEVEAWLLGMRKYFQVQDYLGNMKARVAIFNLNGRESIFWENLRQVNKINDRKIV